MGHLWFETKYNLDSIKKGEIDFEIGDGSTRIYDIRSCWLFLSAHLGALYGIYLLLIGDLSLFNFGISK